MPSIDNIYSVECASDWVKTYLIPDIKPAGDSPFTFPLVEYQEYISIDEISSYRNTYQCVNDASCIEDASLFLTELHQGTQRLLIHELSIIRDGIKRDALDHDNISVIQRERSLESHITDSRITVSISTDDLRIGDHIQFRSTVVESQNEHPFHGRHFSANYSLSWACPVDLQIIRIVNNSGKELSVLREILGDESETLRTEKIEPNSEFEQQYSDLKIERIPDAAPEWVWGSYIQVSTKLEWVDLSQYLYRYFEKNEVLCTLPLTEVQSLGIFSQDDNLEQKALKIIRYVQNNIRYRGEHYGIFTHTPRHPEIILKKRAGDCKDKSNLMMSMLASIGISSRLMLVNTSYGKKISEFNPSPYHFNHMIVDVEFNGQHFFIDATIQKQAGDFKYMAELDYGFGLLLSPKGSKLEKILKTLGNKVFELIHTFDFSHGKDNSSMNIERVYHYHRADNIRSYFDSTEKLKYQQDFYEWAKTDTGLNLEIITSACVKNDNHQLNKLTVIEEYQITDLATTHPVKPIELSTDFFGDFLVPDSNDFPIRISLDGTVQHDIYVKYDQRPYMDISKDKFHNDAFDYIDLVEETKEEQLHYLTRVTPLKRFVESGDVAKLYKKDVERMRQRSNNLIRHKNKRPLMLVFESMIGWALFILIAFLVIKALMWL